MVQLTLTRLGRQKEKVTGKIAAVFAPGAPLFPETSFHLRRYCCTVLSHLLYVRTAMQ